MAEAKFTPGPWAYDGKSRIDALQFRERSTYLDEAGIEHEYYQGLVALPYGCGGSGTHDANAALIATAPDLLGELKTTTFLLTSACLLIEDADARKTALAAVKRARDAIAKATGGTTA